MTVGGLFIGSCGAMLGFEAATGKGWAGIDGSTFEDEISGPRAGVFTLLLFTIKGWATTVLSMGTA